MKPPSPNFTVFQAKETGDQFHFCGSEDSPWEWYTENPTILNIQVLYKYSQGRRHILELGSGPVGVSGTIFHNNVKVMGGHLWSIDKVDFKRESDKFVTYIQGDTLEVKWDKHIDLLFVDAGHGAERVTKELEKYAPWVWRGGLILMDDLRHQAVGEDCKPTLLEAVTDDFCLRHGLTWEYACPTPNKIGVIKVTRPIPSDKIQYLDWDVIKPDNSK